jgi:predicted nucleotidyltransferase
VNDNSPKSEYRIPQSEFRTGELVSDLREITSFRGRFCEQTEEGERILAQGKLERVVAPKGEIYHRLLLGGQGDSMTVKVG